MTEANRDDVIDLMNENTRLLAEVERLRGLAKEMFDRAEEWSGSRASSHYRSEIAARIVLHAGGGDR